MSGFDIQIDVSNLRLDEIALACEASVRPAAQAGAQYFYETVQANVRRLGRHTGNLERSIYQAFDKKASSSAIAAYRVSWRRGLKKARLARSKRGIGKKAAALVSAPHGHLVEFGHWQRYVVYVNKSGEWATAVRPSKRHLPPPSSRASVAEKDAYFVLRKGGPVWVPPKSFLRAAATPGHRKAAGDRMVARFWEEMKARNAI
jgi:hypothetical protein